MADRFGQTFSKEHSNEPRTQDISGLIGMAAARITRGRSAKNPSAQPSTRDGSRRRWEGSAHTIRVIRARDADGNITAFEDLEIFLDPSEITVLFKDLAIGAVYGNKQPGLTWVFRKTTATERVFAGDKHNYPVNPDCKCQVW